MLPLLSVLSAYLLINWKVTNTLIKVHHFRALKKTVHKIKDEMLETCTFFESKTI